MLSLILIFIKGWFHFKIMVTEKITIVSFDLTLQDLKLLDSEISIVPWNSTTVPKAGYSQVIQIFIHSEDNDRNDLNWEINQLSYILKNAGSNIIMEELYRVRDQLIRNSVNLSLNQDLKYQLNFPLRRRADFMGATIPVVTYVSDFKKSYNLKIHVIAHIICMTIFTLNISEVRACNWFS